MKSITYLIYIVLWESFIIGGCSYLVFYKCYSGWWFLLAIYLSSAAYKPEKWGMLK